LVSTFPEQPERAVASKENAKINRRLFRDVGIMEFA